jgi:DNA polymerase III delta subunit
MFGIPMSEPAIRLFVGDAYRCDRALADREAAILASDPGCERHLLFADEIDFDHLAIDLRSASLFSMARHFIVRRAEKAKRPKQLAGLLTEAPSPGTFVTVISGDLKAGSPIVKAGKAAKVLTSLPSPNARNALSAAREILAAEGLSATTDALRELITRSGTNLSLIAQEAKKLRAARAGSEDDGPIDAETVRRLTFSQAEETIYPFYDRLGEGDLHGALAALASLRDDPSRILGGIIRHLTRLAMIRLLVDRRVPKNQVATKVGVQEWLLRRLAGQARQHTLEQLTAALRLSIELDTRLKSGGIRPADAVLAATLAITRPRPSVRG